MAEKRPEEAEALFTKLLYAPYGSLEELQDHMDTFLDKTEEIRQELFPRYYRYKQDRHAVSSYLAFCDYTGLKKKVLKNKGEVYKLSPYKLLWCGDYNYVLGYSEKQGRV